MLTVAYTQLQLLLLRAVASASTAFVLSLVLGKLCIAFQRRRSIGEHIREDGPKQHAGKAGTPTAGGLFFIAATVIAALIWVRSFEVVVVFLAALIGFGAIGLTDDLLKVLKHNNNGLTPIYKVALQIIVSYLLLYLLTDFFGPSTTVYVPWIEQTRIEMGSWYHLAAVFFTVALVNSTNLSDGLDGLAAGLGIIAFITVMAVALALFSFAAETVRAAFLFDGRAELLVGIAAMIGSLLGFLRYNVKPAQIFMGDTGSMAIGGTLACVGLATHNEVIILLISGVFFIETLSVVLQVGFFKIHKKRIFKMAPIHHHFEQIGWKEEKIVLRFWIVSAVFAAAALMAATA